MPAAETEPTVELKLNLRDLTIIGNYYTIGTMVFENSEALKALMFLTTGTLERAMLLLTIQDMMSGCTQVTVPPSSELTEYTRHRGAEIGRLLVALEERLVKEAKS